MKNTFMYIYNGGRRNLKYFYSQTMAAAVVVVVHFTMFLLEQGVFFVFVLLLDHISWINVEQRFLYFLNTFFGSMSSFERCTGIFRFYLNGGLSR